MAASLVSPVLVGRQAESAILNAALAETLAGGQAAVLLGGEAGVGKSRLVQELVERARTEGMRVLSGGCVQLEGGGIALAPLVDMLRTLAREVPAAELEPLLGPARVEVGLLVPELGQDGVRTATAGESDPGRLLELLLGVIDRVAVERPLVTVFEDVQWADRATLDLLALLIARSGGGRLLVVLTARSEELHRSHPFRRMAARWEQQRSVTRLELQRLSPQEVAAQIEAILGRRPDGDLVHFVAERSEGIPLFVEEVLGAVGKGGLDQDYLPPSLRDVLLARAEMLSANGRRVLRVVSAAARWAPDRVLLQVADMSEAELEAGLREAVEQQLLVVDAAGRGYGFRHSLAQAAIHEDLLPGERARLHRAYAEAIEAGGAGDSLDTSSMLAHHWLAAHDLSRALPASVRAGRAAAAASTPAAAQRHFELALELWGQVPDAARQAEIEHAQLLEAAAEAALRAGAVERALALVDEALEEVGADGLPERRASALVRRAAALSDLGRDEESLAALEEAVGLLDAGVGPHTSAWVLGSLAHALARSGHMERCGAFARRALEAAQAAGATEERLVAQVDLALALGHTGEFEQGMQLMRATALEATGAGLHWTAVRCYVNLSDLLLLAGRYEETVTVVDDALPVVEQAGGARTAGIFMRSNRAEALMRAGRLDDALDATATGIEGRGVFSATMPLLRAELHLMRGDQERAEGELREASRHLRSSSSAQFTLPLVAAEAELARLQGQLEAASALLADALESPIAAGDAHYTWPVLALAARVAAERCLAARDRGERPDTGGLDLRLAEQAAQLAALTPSDRGHRALVDAELARARGEGELEAWREAVAVCREMNEPFVLAGALLRYAETLGARGDQEAAAETAREGLTLARSIGAAGLVGEIESLARRARLPLEASRAATSGVSQEAETGSPATDEFGLTAREREVLSLVADGRTNSQIAQALFISRKTASVHVSNILAKLGVASRLEAAAIAHRRGLANPGPVTDA